MTIHGDDPKATKEGAAQQLAEIFAAFNIGIYPPSNNLTRNAIVSMFCWRWPELRRLAHQLHAGIEAEKAPQAPQFKRGQVWLSRDGRTYKIADVDHLCHRITSVEQVHGVPLTWSLSGKMHAPGNSPYDLLQLVSEAPMTDTAPEASYDFVPSEKMAELFDRLAKLDSGWSDVNRQMVNIRSHNREIRAESKETIVRFLKLEGRVAAVDAAVALRFEQSDRHFDQRCESLSKRLDELHNLPERIYGRLADIDGRLDRFAIELGGKVNARVIPDGPGSNVDRYSATAWEIASRYASILGSETRDLAAAIDEALDRPRK